MKNEEEEGIMEWGKEEEEEEEKVVAAAAFPENHRCRQSDCEGEYKGQYWSSLFLLTGSTPLSSSEGRRASGFFLVEYCFWAKIIFWGHHYLHLCSGQIEDYKTSTSEIVLPPSAAAIITWSSRTNRVGLKRSTESHWPSSAYSLANAEVVLSLQTKFF